MKNGLNTLVCVCLLLFFKNVSYEVTRPQPPSWSFTGPVSSQPTTVRTAEARLNSAMPNVLQRPPFLRTPTSTHSPRSHRLHPPRPRRVTPPRPYPTCPLRSSADATPLHPHPPWSNPRAKASSRWPLRRRNATSCVQKFSDLWRRASRTSRSSRWGSTWTLTGMVHNRTRLLHFWKGARCS